MLLKLFALLDIFVLKNPSWGQTYFYYLAGHDTG